MYQVDKVREKYEDYPAIYKGGDCCIVVSTYD